MEHVRQRGSFDELPLDEILDEFRATYPPMFEHCVDSADPVFRPA